MPLSYYHNAYVNVIPKRIKASSRDVVIEETQMEEKHETKNDELVYNA